MTMRPTPQIDILLATYNGSRFVQRQIDSILEQMNDRCRLLIRDDASSDGTRELINKIAAENAGRVVVMHPDGDRLGACGSFSRLVERSDADYLMFCDQDDAWLPGHIAKPLERIRAIERACGVDMPILVHTDLVVADATLNTICPSFWAYSRLAPDRVCRLNRLLMQNVVTGCVTTINRALARLACPIPAGAAMHDWWLALVAATFGHIEAIGDATTLYRQHSNNCVGANGYDWRYVRRKFDEVLRGEAMAKWRATSKRQAEEFRRQFVDRLTPQHRATLDAYVNLENGGYFSRRFQILRHGFLKTGLIRNVGWLLMA